MSINLLRAVWIVFICLSVLVILNGTDIILKEDGE